MDIFIVLIISGVSMILMVLYSLSSLFTFWYHLNSHHSLHIIKTRSEDLSPFMRKRRREEEEEEEEGRGRSEMFFATGQETYNINLCMKYDLLLKQRSSWYFIDVI